MLNWYKRFIYREARRGTDRPLMDEYSEFGPQKDQLSLTRATPFFGGERRNTPDGKGYPKGISMNQDYEDENKGIHELQPGRTI